MPTFRTVWHKVSGSLMCKLPVVSTGKCQNDLLKNYLYVFAAGVMHSSIMSTLSPAFTIIQVLLTLAAVPTTLQNLVHSWVCLA